MKGENNEKNESDNTLSQIDSPNASMDDTKVGDKRGSPQQPENPPPAKKASPDSKGEGNEESSSNGNVTN